MRKWSVVIAGAGLEGPVAARAARATDRELTAPRPGARPRAVDGKRQRDGAPVRAAEAEPALPGIAGP